MKYKNASDVLPDKLLKELQKYASGETIYVPSEDKRKKWGAKTGARIFYEQRNEEIRAKYFKGNISIDELSVEYSLSYETIRKIVYR